mgnify:CR=1 FL=1
MTNEVLLDFNNVTMQFGGVTALSDVSVKIFRGEILGLITVSETYTRHNQNMTNEYAIGHYYKRLSIIDLLFGNQDYHATRYEALEAAK